MHVQPFSQLVAGTAAQVGSDNVIAQQVFGKRIPRLKELRAGSAITIIEDALGQVISSTAGVAAIDSDQAILPNRVFDIHLPRIREVRAGSGVTVTEDALGYIVSASSGTPDDSQAIIAGQSYGKRTAQPVGLAGGDLTGTYPNPSVIAERLVDALRTFIHTGNASALVGLAGGDLAGFFPNPTVRTENLITGIQSLLPHPQQIPDVRGGTTGIAITVTRDARGFVLTIPPESDQLVLAMQSLIRHPQAIPDVRGSANVTVTQDARGYTVSISFESDQNILPNRVYSPHPPRVEDVRVAGGATLTRDAQGVTITAGSANESDQQILPPRVFDQHQPPIPDVRTTGGATVTRDAQGYLITAAGAPDTDSAILPGKIFGARQPLSPRTQDDPQEMNAVKAFLEHQRRIDDVRAGTGITLTRDAQGVTLSQVYDSDQEILPPVMYSRHQPWIAGVRAGTNITVTLDALGYTISATAGGSGDSDQSILPGRIFEAQHVQLSTTIVGGDLEGVMPNPGVREENLISGILPFLPRFRMPNDLVPVEDTRLQLSIRAFERQHLPRIPEIQAGTNITIVQNARGPVISASGGSASNPHLISSNTTLAAGEGNTIPRYLEIGAGVTYEIGSNADLEIG